MTSTAMDALPEISGERPSRLDQLRFGVRVLRLTGVLALATGVVFFVAANWDALGIAGRFALLELFFLAGIVVAIARPPPAMLGRYALLSSFIVAGALLALFGQTYQTGANLYELFLTWALLGIPLVIASRWSVTWAAGFGVLNTALALYCGWSPEGGALWMLFGDRGLTSTVLLMIPAAVNLSLWLVCEHLRGRTPEWLGRFVIACAIAFGTWAAIVVLSDHPFIGWVLTPANIATLLAQAALLLFVAIHTLRQRRDVFPLTLVAASLIALGFVTLIRVFHEYDALLMLIVAAWLIASSTLSSIGLLRTMRSWRGEVASPVRKPDRPWYLSMVLGIAAWLAGIFVLAFAWMILDTNHYPEMFISGAVLFGAALALFRFTRHNTFTEQLGLAFWIAGQFAILAAMLDITNSEALTCAAILLLQIVLWVVTPSQPARMMAAFFACCAWALAIRFTVLGDDLFGGRQRSSAAEVLFTWILVWPAVAAGAWALVAKEATWMATSWRDAIRPALSGVLLGLCVASISSDPLESLFLGSFELNAMSWFAFWPLLDVALALLAMWLAFRVQSRAAIGAAIAAALVHTSRLYFLLGLSLLVKSAILIVLGVALLATTRLMTRQVDDLTRESP